MRMCIYTGLILVLALCVTGAGAAHAAEPQKALIEAEQSFRDAAAAENRALLAILAVEGVRALPVGTGFLIDPNGTFLTAAHVINGEYPNTVSLRALALKSKNPMQLRQFEIVQIDTEHDVALCRIVEAADSKHSENAGEGYDALELSVNVPAPGTFVAVAGFPLGAPVPTFQFGTVASFAEPGDRLQLNVQLNDGDSGGPVVEVHSGKVIGIALSVRTAQLYGSSAESATQQNAGLSWAMPVQSIGPLLRNHNIRPR